ncbi:SsgA family sporulation/cell division regulator [Streptomyces sp. NPDC097704]|uniref:SsgA family sporulation/cell division regulator n=1 Tax=Streptomyces sp. NPDC097704 TaxID=3157101 RepID=UPI003327F591
MSDKRSGLPARRSATHDPLRLTLDIERVLGLTVRQAVRAEFRFDPASPLTVCVEFIVEGGPRVLWRIGRDLLQQGLNSMSGLGSVQIWPSNRKGRATAWLQLASTDTAALFELPVPPLAAWLEHTYGLVPAGSELTDVDWDIATTTLLRDPEVRAD